MATEKSHTKIIKLEGNLKEVRKKLQEINLKNRFSVLTMDYGVGKTQKIEQDILSGEIENGYFFSRRHDRLNETEELFEKEGFDDFIHLYGFAHIDKETKEPKGCPLFIEDKSIQRLYRLQISPTIICQIKCNSRKKCSYIKQFNKQASWKISPHEFLSSLKPRTFNVVDEPVTEVDTIYIPKLEPDTSVLTKYTGAVYEDYSLIPKHIIYDAMIKAGRDGNFDDLYQLKEIEMSMNFLFLDAKRNVIPYAPKQFSVPRIWKVFDIVNKGFNVTLIDGAFSLSLFEYFRDLYNEEIPEPTVYTSEIKNKNTVVIRTAKDVNYHKGSNDDRNYYYNLDFFSHPTNVIRACLRAGKRVGVITFKEIENEFKMDGVITGHYGDTSGTNKFIDCDYLFLIGEYHYGNEAIHDLYKKYFGTEPMEDMNKERMELIYQLMEDTSIEAGLRSRGYEHNKMIIFFRSVPELFKERFTYKEMKVEELRKMVEKDAPKMVERFVPDVPKIADIITAMPYARNITHLAEMLGCKNNYKKYKELKEIVKILDTRKK